MAKKVREENKWTIPSDWNEANDGYQLAVICVPNSRQWRGIFIGQISDLAYGRNYNKLTGTITDAQAIARDIFESMAMTCLDDVIIALQCVCSSITTLAEKSDDTGQEVDTPLSDGTVMIGPGEQFPDQQTYFDAKCNVSNGIYDTVRETVQWLEDNNVDVLAGVFGGVTSGLIVGLLGAGPVGWAIVLVASVTAGLASFLIRYSIDFFDLKTALSEVHDECVLALYNADAGSTARANFITEVENATQPITPIESNLLELLLSNEMVNQLFEPRSDLEDYASPDPVDCGGAILQVWDFDSDLEGWTHSDDSDPSCSAAASYNATEESVHQELVIASLPHVCATGRNISPTVSIPTVAGSSVQADYAGTSDGRNQGVEVKAIYTDATYEETTSPGPGGVGPGPGTRILTLVESKTVETVEVRFRRCTSGSANGSSYTTELLEVRIIGL